MRKLLIVLTLVATSASAQTKRAATFDDVLNIKGIQGVTVSPDGRQVIYGVREWVAEQDKMESRTHLWKVPADGSSAARQIAQRSCSCAPISTRRCTASSSQAS